MKAATVFGVLLSVVVAGRSASADEGSVYVWVDKDGTPHYQDRPPEGDQGQVSARELSLRYRMTDPQAVAAASKVRAEQEAENTKREAARAEEAAAAKSDREQVLGEREQGCAKAKERLEKFDTSHRLYRPGPDGQRIYLTDEELASARAEAARTVDEWCGE
jgi:hypothetical protein